MEEHTAGCGRPRYPKRQIMEQTTGEIGLDFNHVYASLFSWFMVAVLVIPTASKAERMFTKQTTGDHS